MMDDEMNNALATLTAAINRAIEAAQPRLNAIEISDHLRRMALAVEYEAWDRAEPL